MSYKDLKSYQNAEILYDFTVEFCKRHIDSKSRTTDQMTQAARSGKQNIVEASANPTSDQSELMLLGVSRGSFQELLEDYEDFLRQRGLRKWSKEDPEAKVVRELSSRSNKSYESYRSYLEDPALAANVALCLIHQTNYLLDRQIASRETAFVQHGGYREQLKRQRDEELKRRLLPHWSRKDVLKDIFKTEEDR